MRGRSPAAARRRDRLTRARSSGSIDVQELQAIAIDLGEPLSADELVVLMVRPRARADAGALAR